MNGKPEMHIGLIELILFLSVLWSVERMWQAWCERETVMSDDECARVGEEAVAKVRDKLLVEHSVDGVTLQDLLAMPMKERVEWFESKDRERRSWELQRNTAQG